MDPLSLIREFVISNQIDQVAVINDIVDFAGRASFNPTARTAYKSRRGEGEFYDLQSVLFFAQNLNAKFGEYFRQAKERGLTQVSYIDREDLSDYLSGRKATSDHIHFTLPELQLNAEPAEAPAKRARLDDQTPAAAAAPAAATDQESAELTALRGILANERQLRDRNSMLTLPNKSFAVVVANSLKAVQRQQDLELQRERELEEERARSQATKRPAPVPENRPSGRYQRETAPDAALKTIGAQNLGLQQVGFAEAPMPGGPPPPPPPSSSQPGPSRHVAPPQAEQRPPPSSASHDHREKKVEKPRGTPIILVPALESSVINMWNAKAFFQDGVYKTVEQCKAEKIAEAQSKWEERKLRWEARKAKYEERKAKAEKDNAEFNERFTEEMPVFTESSVKRDGVVRILRKIATKEGQKPIFYNITDKEPKKEEDWAKVVGVFVLGKPWQFKYWPYPGAKEGDMVATFNTVCGVYLHYSDEPVSAMIKGWNVKLLPLSRHSRHRDLTVATDYFRQLDSFLEGKLAREMAQQNAAQNGPGR